MLKLSRATVLQADPVSGPEQRVLIALAELSTPRVEGGGPVELEGAARAQTDGAGPAPRLSIAGSPASPWTTAAAARPAIADIGLVGPCAVGDEVIVNVQALDLGSGGFGVVHVNLTRGLGGGADGEGASGGVMKLNCTSLQHVVHPVQEGEEWQLTLPCEGVVAVLALHGQLPSVAWSFARGLAGGRLGYVQTAGGALPGGHSLVVRELRARGLLAGHITAGAAFGGEGEALTTAEALNHGLGALGWDAALCGPGPGITGGLALGDDDLAALDAAHTALALGCTTLLVPRMSSGDPGTRRRGISRHTLAVLDLLLEPVTVALPAGLRSPVGAELHAGLGAVFGALRPARPQLQLNVERPARIARHDWRRAPVDLPAFAASGLPLDTLGRGPLEDPLSFGAALAGGAVLAELTDRRRPDDAAATSERSEDGEEAMV